MAPAILERSSTFPLPLGKTKCSSLTGWPFASFLPVARRGQASFHSLSVLITSGGAGIVRRLAAAFGLPMPHHLSARWRTVMVEAAKSTSHHVSPRSSDARRPTSAATMKNARRKPLAARRTARISAGLGISTPISSRF